MRSKRPDTRPNGEMRKRISRKIEEQKVIQDLRITRKRKEELKVRDVQILPLRKKSKPEDEKRLRTLKKKLRSIDELIKLKDAGNELDEQQIAKIDKLDETMEEMQKLIGFNIST